MHARVQETQGTYNTPLAWRGAGGVCGGLRLVSIGRRNTINGYRGTAANGGDGRASVSNSGAREDRVEECADGER